MGGLLCQLIRDGWLRPKEQSSSIVMRLGRRIDLGGGFSATIMGNHRGELLDGIEEVEGLWTRGQS